MAGRSQGIGVELMRILILDDDLERLALFKDILHNHDVTEVMTASETIHHLKLGTWDVVFLDHDLGGRAFVPSGPETGYEVAEFLQNNINLRPSKIFLHSMNDTARRRMLAILPRAVECPGVWVDALWMEDLLPPS